MINAVLQGKQDSGNPHVRFDEGSAKTRRWSLFYRTFRMVALLLAVVCLAALPDRAFAGRSEQLLNDGWTGTMTPESGEVRKLERIDIPHNWDDYHGYRHWYHGNQHGSAVYSRMVTLAKKEGERYFLVFEGAGSYLTVRVNGNEVCTKRPASRLVVTVEVTGNLRGQSLFG